MPDLNWERFLLLPGSRTSNWEGLCRSVVLRSLGSLGSFRGTVMQPGVEFHLKVDQKSDTLGDPGRWWGWQCRWYDTAPGTQIGATRRQDIIDAIRKTEERLPGVTDWVLWTRRALTQTDQDWFFGIPSSMRLHLWTEWHLEANMVGEASILRDTYFGDLTLTAESLRRLRDATLAPVRERWNPVLHVEVQAEQEIRKVLGDPAYWSELDEIKASLALCIGRLRDSGALGHEASGESAQALLEDLVALHTTFSEASGASTHHDLRLILGLRDSGWAPQTTRAKGRQLARQLRRADEPSALDVQASLAVLNDSFRLFEKLRFYLSISLLAVVGEAGRGKTFLGAELTEECAIRPCGLYIQGWPLRRAGTINDLLPRLRGLNVNSFEQVLEAVESAGVRTGARIPIVIDGLTESEDPANWQSELASLETTLGELEHVVVIVTLRPSGEEITLPEGCPKIILPGFGPLTEAAAKLYLNFYKIDSGGIHLPLELMSNPLFLRIFCEATNPERDSVVGPESIPASLIEAMLRFKDNVVQRIARRPGGVPRYTLDIQKAIDAIASSLWDTHRRAMPFDELRVLIGDTGIDWTVSLAQALEDEGLLLRDSEALGEQRTAVVFDALAGLLLADVLTKRKGRDDFETWIREDTTIRRLTTGLPEAHPLSSDIRKALAGLMPRRFSTQLWTMLEGDLQTESLMDACDLEGNLLDSRTLDEVARVSVLAPSGYPMRDVFDRFRETSDADLHPLNSEFLNRILLDLSVAARDLRWSEWVRRHEESILADLTTFTDSWRDSSTRNRQDQLRAQWVTWLLTSTVRHLRDRATLALYWYGRAEPGGLFELTLAGLECNDPYVPERLLAAAFGVVMSSQAGGINIDSQLASFLDVLWSSFCAPDASSPTDHWLMRDYVEGIVELTRKYHPGCLGRWSDTHVFATPARPAPVSRDRRAPDRDPVHGMDFRNYTVGRLVEGRGNYQENHEGYQEVLSWIRARVLDLGWEPQLYDGIESSIARSRGNRDGRADRVEVYGKKYGWIGFFEAAGRLSELNRLPERYEEGRLSDADIDPSFPDIPPALDLNVEGWLPVEPLDMKEWMQSADVRVPDSLLRRPSLLAEAGPWIALEGFLEKEDDSSTRRVFGFIRGMFVPKASVEKLLTWLAKRDYPGNYWIPDQPKSYYMFAGEFPWTAHLRAGRDFQGIRKLYQREIEQENGEAIVIELPAHDYSWEDYHSIVNQAGGHPVPSVALADYFDLRVLPNSLDWCDSNGQRASITLSKPDSFNYGDLLYVREDLLREYCTQFDLDFIWFVWGERDFALSQAWRRPEWVQEIFQTHAEIWRRIVRLDEIAPVDLGS